MQPSTEFPIPGLVAYEQFRQRMREHYAAVRSLFVERFREFRLDPPPPESAFLNCDNRYEGDGKCWHIWWDGEGPRYRFWTFPPTPAPYPVFSWDELATFGVEPNQLSCFIDGVFSDVAADAWEDAGGFAVSRPISIDSFLWRSAADGRGWVDRLTMWIKEAAAALPAGPGDARSSRVQPLTCGKMPPIPSDIIAACQDGDRNALLAWADVLEAAGARDEAELLRWLPRFRESIAEGVTVYLGQGAFYLFSVPLVGRVRSLLPRHARAGWTGRAGAPFQGRTGRGATAAIATKVRDDQTPLQELLLELRPTLPFVSPPEIPSVRGLPASLRDGCSLDSNLTSCQPPFGSA